MFEEILHYDLQHDKIIYPFKKNDGFIRPCFRGCPNCCYKDKVFWDYSHGVYAVTCQLHGVHDILCPDYENDGTQPLSISEWNELKRKEMGDSNNGNTKQ